MNICKPKKNKEDLMHEISCINNKIDKLNNDKCSFKTTTYDTRIYPYQPTYGMPGLGCRPEGKVKHYYSVSKEFGTDLESATELENIINAWLESRNVKKVESLETEKSNLELRLADKILNGDK